MNKNDEEEMADGICMLIGIPLTIFFVIIFFAFCFKVAIWAVKIVELMF